jgi:hypothetical protein
MARLSLGNSPGGVHHPQRGTTTPLLSRTAPGTTMRRELPPTMAENSAPGDPMRQDRDRTPTYGLSSRNPVICRPCRLPSQGRTMLHEAENQNAQVSNRLSIGASAVHKGDDMHVTDDPMSLFRASIGLTNLGAAARRSPINPRGSASCGRTRSTPVPRIMPREPDQRVTRPLISALRDFFSRIWERSHDALLQSCGRSFVQQLPARIS